MLEYFKPTSIQEATQLRASRSASCYLGGGTIVNSLSWEKQVQAGRCQAYEALIDVTALPLDGISCDDEYIYIGGNVTLQDILENALTPELLRQNLRQFVNRNVRNVATIGGSLASRQSCSNATAALVALHAEVEVCRYDAEKKAVECQFVSVEDYENCDCTQALISQVRVPKCWAGKACATRNYSRSMHDISLLVADVILSLQNGIVESISVSACGVASRVLRLSTLEKALQGQALPEREKLAELVKADIKVIDDFRSSAEFKAYTITELVDWCLHNAAAPAEHKCSCAGKR